MGDTDGRPSEAHVRRSRELLATLLPALREVARRHGYALAVHGSLERDIDLIAAPWRDGCADAASLAEAFFSACCAIVGFATWPGGWTDKATFAPPPGSLPNPDRKPLGRLGYSIMLSGGPYLDISIMPRGAAAEHSQKRTRKRSR